MIELNKATMAIMISYILFAVFAIVTSKYMGVLVALWYPVMYLLIIDLATIKPNSSHLRASEKMIAGCESAMKDILAMHKANNDKQ